jgi:3-(3-hydroxy-phenyl)propionate hydroxylase
MVLRGQASEALIDSSHQERAFAGDENIPNSTRSTDFITPKSKISHVFRNAVLELAERHAFARPIVNSGRLSVPSIYDGLALTGPDALPQAPSRSRPGSPCPDVARGAGFLLDHFGGGFTLLALGCAAPEWLEEDGITAMRLAFDAPPPLMAERYLGAAPAAIYLIRADQYVVGHWPAFDEAAIRATLRRVCGGGG